MTYGVRNPSASLCRAQRCGGVKPVNDIITLPFLRIGSPTPIDIKNNRKITCIDSIPLKCQQELVVIDLNCRCTICLRWPRFSDVLKKAKCLLR